MTRSNWENMKTKQQEWSLVDTSEKKKKKHKRTTDQYVNKVNERHYIVMFLLSQFFSWGAIIANAKECSIENPLTQTSLGK